MQTSVFQRFCFKKFLPFERFRRLALSKGIAIFQYFVVGLRRYKRTILEEKYDILFVDVSGVFTYTVYLLKRVLFPAIKNVLLTVI